MPINNRSEFWKGVKTVLLGVIGLGFGTYYLVQQEFALGRRKAIWISADAQPLFFYGSIALWISFGAGFIFWGISEIKESRRK